LPTTSGSGLTTITNWMSCAISPTFDNSLDPHAITAYQSPNTGDAIALVSGNDQSILAVVDLTLMLSLEETMPGSHLCASGILPSTVVTLQTPGTFTTASGLLPAGTAIRRPADTNGVGLEIRYLIRR